MATIDEAIHNLGVFGDAFDEGIQAALDALGRDSVVTMKAITSVPVFPRSSPGQPPRRETGGLQASESYKVGGSRGDRTVAVGASKFYAGYLEGGTRKMAARPFVAPALAYHVARFPATLAAAVGAHTAAARARMAG